MISSSITRSPKLCRSWHWLGGRGRGARSPPQHPPCRSLPTVVFHFVVGALLGLHSLFDVYWMCIRYGAVMRWLWLPALAARLAECLSVCLTGLAMNIPPAIRGLPSLFVVPQPICCFVCFRLHWPGWARHPRQAGRRWLVGLTRPQTAREFLEASVCLYLIAIP